MAAKRFSIFQLPSDVAATVVKGEPVQPEWQSGVASGVAPSGHSIAYFYAPIERNISKFKIFLTNEGDIAEKLFGSDAEDELFYVLSLAMDSRPGGGDYCPPQEGEPEDEAPVHELYEVAEVHYKGRIVGKVEVTTALSGAVKTDLEGSTAELDAAMAGISISILEKVDAPTFVAELPGSVKTAINRVAAALRNKK